MADESLYCHRLLYDPCQPRVSLRRSLPVLLCFVCVLVCVFVCLFVCLSVCLTVCLLACLLAWLLVCLFVCLFACLLVCLLACLFACLLVCLLACLLACLFVCLFVCLFFVVVVVGVGVVVVARVLVFLVRDSFGHSVEAFEVELWTISVVQSDEMSQMSQVCMVFSQGNPLLTQEILMQFPYRFSLAQGS